MVLFGNPGNFCNAYQGRGGGERRTDWFSPSRGNKEPKSFPFSSFKLTWDLPLHPRSHKYLNLMNFTAGVDSNQSFFRGIHPYVLFGRANVDRESTVPSLAHSFVLRNESRATSCSSNSRTISNHFARGIIFFQFSKPSPSRRLVFLQPTLLPFFFLSCYFLDIEYRVSMRYGEKKKKRKTIKLSFRPSAFRRESVRFCRFCSMITRAGSRINSNSFEEGRNFVELARRERDRCETGSVADFE